MAQERQDRKTDPEPVKVDPSVTFLSKAHQLQRRCWEARKKMGSASGGVYWDGYAAAIEAILAEWDAAYEVT